MTKEIPTNTTATLNKAVGNASAALLLSRIVYWNTRKKGGVEYQGRMWSYRSQKEWIEQEAGLRERTGKLAWARLVKGDFILAEMRWGGPHGNRRYRMHVALSDKTYGLLGEACVPSLEKPVHNAELKLKDYAKAVYAEKVKAGYDALKAKEEEELANEAPINVKSAWEVYKEKYAEPGE